MSQLGRAPAGAYIRLRHTQPDENHKCIRQEHCVHRGEHTVQLLRRHWHICDADGTLREVEGEGVVGQQPVLEPGEAHEYVSGCNLRTGIGKMYGTYQMARVLDGKQFDVRVPEFTMVVPFRLN